jgi:hypothetical protein
MTAPRNSDNLIRTFLDDGLVELPDRTYDAVRRDIHRTRQRTVIGPWKEPTVTTLSRLAIAAAVLVAVGIAWINFGPQANIGPPNASPSPSPALISGDNRELQPGRYRFDYGLAAGTDEVPGGTSLFITVPDLGWTNYGAIAVDRNYGVTAETAGASLVMWKITNRFENGCGGLTPLDPSPGPGIDEILQSLADQPGIEAGPLTDVTVDGYAGKFVELTVAINIATCPDEFYVWLDKFVQGNNEVLRVYALDVGGERFTFFARIPVMTTAEHRAQLESIIASIDIEP